MPPQPAFLIRRLLAARWLSSLFAALFLAGVVHAHAADPRALVVEAALSESVEDQERMLRGLASAGGDAWVEQALTAWRGGTLYLHETDEARVPFLLDPQAADAEGRARGLRVADGEPIRTADGQPVLFSSHELVAVDATSRLRRAIKATLDLLALSNPDPRMRRDAIVKLGQEQSADYLPHFEGLLGTERSPVVRKALEEAIALTRIAADDAATRDAAVRRLAELRSISSLSHLQQLKRAAEADVPRYGSNTVAVASRAVFELEQYIWRGNLFGTAFRGLSLAAVLLVAALGLAITFGLMGVINMAHGEIIMVGAYTAYVTQNLFQGWFGAGTRGFDAYFIAALGVAFVVAAGVGLVLERGVIRFLYKRPLESLLATWGVSLVLQQLFRHVFGAANVQVSSPGWLSGSLVVHDVLLAYNRLFVIAFAVGIVAGTYLLLSRTPLGLQIRAVMQNRPMAAALGVRTDRVNMLTFAFGSGLAGMAGACLSQIGNVGPSLGQSYIVDCFMVVVLGGVGNLVGTVVASLGVGVTDQVLQPWLGAVMGKIVVLGGIILFLQWRPAGLFANRSRNLEG